MSTLGQLELLLIIARGRYNFLCFFLRGQGLIILDLREHLWIGEVMEMLLWKVVSLFILLHNLGSSGKNLLRTGIECNSFILNLLKTSLEKVYCKFDFSLLRSVRMAMKNTARFPDQTGTFRRTKMHDLK